MKHANYPNPVRDRPSWFQRMRSLLGTAGPQRKKNRCLSPTSSYIAAVWCPSGLWLFISQASGSNPGCGMEISISSSQPETPSVMSMDGSPLNPADLAFRYSPDVSIRYSTPSPVGRRTQVPRRPATRVYTPPEHMGDPWFGHSSPIDPEQRARRMSPVRAADFLERWKRKAIFSPLQPDDIVESDEELPTMLEMKMRQMDEETKKLPPRPYPRPTSPARSPAVERMREELVKDDDRWKYVSEKTLRLFFFS
ncbi:hypothetical protein CDAR_464011 [Caerostris darwini]|uniref:Uncharacterized protein n=1 Tax=Caerostris darwini TaxID=1538125 RepID=A0AAV4VWN0_9ARAC|nr:hypothetical protein CDAR_464011 [Caerostris darwini]